MSKRQVGKWLCCRKRAGASNKEVDWVGEAGDSDGLCGQGSRLSLRVVLETPGGLSITMTRGRLRSQASRLDNDWMDALV